MVIIGPYGSGNLGDEAMLKPFLYFLQNSCIGKLSVIGLKGEFLDSLFKEKYRFTSYFNLVRLFKTIKEADLVILGSGCLFKTVSAIKLLPVFLLNRLLKKKTVVFGVEAYPMPPLLSRIVFSLLKKSILWVVRTHLSKRLLEKYGVPPRKLRLFQTSPTPFRKSSR
ncbi:hypothetical protein DRO53_04645 [Candidatus Bathyarchaeota archaeon]|nr:MAG: hypothetical protein DRO53_04645 [Candidatus Bathyarchaeota archaeon]